MNKLHTEAELAAVAKHWRKKSGKRQQDAAQLLEIARPSVVQAENNPERALLQVRKRLIETYSPYKVEGPFYRLVKK